MTTDASAAPLTKWQEQLNSYVASGYQILYIQTSEEGRVEREIARLCDAKDMHMVTWDVVVGLDDGGSRALGMTREAAAEFVDPTKALKYITSDANQNDTVYVFRDLDDFYAKSPVIRRQLQSISEHAMLSRTNDSGVQMYRPMIIISSASGIPPKLAQYVAVLDYALPTDKDIDHIVDFILASPVPPLSITDDLREQTIRCLAGLTSSEIENSFSRAIHLNGSVSPGILPIIKAEKAKIIKKGDVLTYIPEDSTGDLGDIGGFEAFNEWIQNRAACYSKAAIEQKLDFPKGIGLLGPPGTAKSVAAKMLCKTLNLPGYNLNIGAIFGSLVGESEGRVRDAIKQIEAQNGAVVVIDEVDKALGGAAGGKGDSGVSSRVLGTILTWLAEKTSPTFVVMTMNRIDDLPPELLRSGRFDAIFCTDLPTDSARKDIFNIHLKKRDRLATIAELDADPRKWAKLIASTKDFVGAEIESAIVDAQCTSFTARGIAAPTYDDLLVSVEGTVPLARLQAKAVESMRQFAKDGRAKPVWKESTNEKTAKRVRNLNVPPSQIN